MSHYDGIYNNSNVAASVTQTKTSFLNTSSISFDLLNTNANMVKTRYDVKSLSSSSLYGSRVIIIFDWCSIYLINQIFNILFWKKSVQGISTNTNPSGIPSSQKQQSYRSSKRFRVKELIMKKIFKEDDSYATGEYSKEENGGNVDNVFYSEKGEKRETWSGKFDVIINFL